MSGASTTGTCSPMPTTKFDITLQPGYIVNFDCRAYAEKIVKVLGSEENIRKFLWCMDVSKKISDRLRFVTWKQVLQQLVSIVFWRMREMKHMCTCCGYEYDPALGDSDGGVDPGTEFDKLPEDWTCPVCGLSKDGFEKSE